MLWQERLQPLDVAERLFGALRDIDVTIRRRARGPPVPYIPTADDVKEPEALGCAQGGPSQDDPPPTRLTSPCLGQ